jgi:hypothetical protein
VLPIHFEFIHRPPVPTTGTSGQRFTSKVGDFHPQITGWFCPQTDNGTDLGLMIVAEAQKRASEQGAELFVIERTAKPPVVRIVEVRKWKLE